MLPLNSTNAVLPGGPVSSVAGRKEIFAGAKTRISTNTGSTCGRSTITGASCFALLAASARRILQHSTDLGGDLSGFEWNGQALWFVSLLFATARIAQ